jgi:hypothetical protein
MDRPAPFMAQANAAQGRAACMLIDGRLLARTGALAIDIDDGTVTPAGARGPG